MVCNLYLYSAVFNIIMEVGFLHPSLSAIQETWVPSLDGEDSPGGGHGNLLQDSCLENPMERGDWWAIVRGVAKSWT